MKQLLMAVILITFYSCGNNEEVIANNQATIQGIEKPNYVVDLADIDPGLACSNGGVSIFTFNDLDNDGVHRPEEPIVKSKTICHGTSVSINLESVASSAACPNGGVKISATGSSTVEVCHGSQGLQGAQGIQGQQGLQGIQGASGSVVTPVKFCPTDNSSFPEYGLMIDGELYAVFWGPTPASSAHQAFLSKVTSGNYVSTGGNGCLFSVP